MRELENSEMVMQKAGYFSKSVSLPGRKERTHLPLPEALLAGHFALIDTFANNKVDFEIIKISAETPESPYSAQRCGLAQGRREYFNRPGGWDLDLCFIAEKVPALGYKTYRLQPSRKLGNTKNQVVDDKVIENEYYRITIGDDEHAVTSIFDKEQNRELLDAKSPHAFGEIIVRSPSNDFLGRMTATTKPELVRGKIVSSLTLYHTVYGHPTVCSTLLLYSGIKKIDFIVKILKDSTPLLDVHIAFPFAAQSPQFRYEGTLNVLRPVKDFLPEAYSDALAVQNWVEVQDGNNGLLWSSSDAPVVALGKLWPGYVSPAHACAVPLRMKHLPQKMEDFKHGWIYSSIFNNNFCTNFSVTQSGEFVFRYSMSTIKAVNTASRSVRFGLCAVTPFETIFSSGKMRGELPLNQGLISTVENDIILFNCKLSEDRQGIIMRFWNPNNIRTISRINFTRMKISRVYKVNPAEESNNTELIHDGSGFCIEMGELEVASVMVLCHI